MLDYVTIGKRIRIKRKDRRITQAALAKKAGISESFFGHIERGRRKASVETLINIANALQTDMNYLLADALLFDGSFTEYTSLSLKQQGILRKIAILMLSSDSPS